MDVLSAVIVLVAALSSARGQALFATPAVAEEPNGT
jgi:hypothetical protein